jgi:hypothetical protein
LLTAQIGIVTWLTVMAEIRTAVAGFTTTIGLNNRCPSCKLQDVIPTKPVNVGFVERNTKMRKLLLSLALALGTASVAHANSGALLPLDQYQPGTEQVQNTIVTNGNFENTVAGVPTGWTPLGTFQSAAPTGPNTSAAVNGSFAAQGPLGSALQRNGFTQVVTLAPNTDYFLSGYAWNFSPINFDLTLVELRDSLGNVKNFSLAPNDNSTGPQIDGSRGVFGYKSFNSGAFTGAVTLQVAFEYDANTAFPQGRPNISGQIDNVAITPANLFAPPQAVPEPVGIGALALAGIAVMRRRRA